MGRVGIGAFTLAALVGLWALFSLEPWPASYPSDIQTDKVATEGAWFDSGSTGVAPRTPAALLIQAPLLLMEEPALSFFMGVLSILGLLTACWAVSVLTPVPPWVCGVAAAAIAGVKPMTNVYAYGNTAALVAGLVAVGWVMRRRPFLAGTALACAAALKLWPLVVIAVLGTKAKKTALASVLAFGLLNLAGLALPGVTLAGQLEALSAGQQFIDYGWNLSIVRAIGPVPAAIAAAAVIAAVLRWVDDPEACIACSIVVGILISPLAWPWYWLAAIPAAAVLTFRCVTISSGRQQMRAGKVESRVSLDTGNLEAGYSK